MIRKILECNVEERRKRGRPKEDVQKEGGKK